LGGGGRPASEGHWRRAKWVHSGPLCAALPELEPEPEPEPEFKPKRPAPAPSRETNEEGQIAGFR